MLQSRRGAAALDPESQNRKRKVDRQDVAHLRRLFGYVRPYRGRLIFGIIAVTVASVVALLFPLLIRNLLNSAFAPNANAVDARALLDRKSVV